MMCALGVVCPQCDSAVSRRREEREVLWVPPTLNHLVAVLSHYGQRQLFGQVTYKHSTCILKPPNYTFTTTTTK